MSKNGNEDRKQTGGDALFEALSAAAEPYADDAYRSMETKKDKKKPALLRFLPAAAAMLAIVVAGGLLLPPLLNGGSTKPEVPPIEETPGAILPPWRGSDFSFKTVSFRGRDDGTEDNRVVSYRSGYRLDNENGTDPAETDPVGNGSEPFVFPGVNIPVSLSPSNRVNGFTGSLMRLAAGTELHETCDSVWYDLEKDEVFCLSCFLREKMHKDPRYLDACVRCLIENGMIPVSDLLAGEAGETYRTLYTLLYSETALNLFASLDHPTVETLGLTGTVADTVAGRAAVASFRYPEVKVIEYGQDPGHCLFTLYCPDGSGVFGCYVYDFSAQTFTKIDGESVGVARCLDHTYAESTTGLSPDLSLASGVLIEGNYSRILVTVPYYVSELEIVSQKGQVEPKYEASAVLLFTLDESGAEMTCLNEALGQKDPRACAPLAPARRTGGYVWYSLRDGMTCISDGKGNAFVTDGELRGIFGMNGKLPGDSADFALLSVKGKDVWVSLPYGFSVTKEYALETIGSGAYLLNDDRTVRIDLRTGETTALFEGKTVLATALTADGRFLFALTGEGVEGIDLMTMERALLSLPAEFEEAVGALNGISFTLLLDDTEKTLLLTYCRVGTPAFDREAFLNAAEGGKFRLPDLYPGNSSMLEIFDSNVKNVLSYYTVDGSPLRITETDRYVKLVRIVAIPLLETYFEKEAHVRAEEAALFAGIAERMLPTLRIVGTYGGEAAEVDAALVLRAYNGLGETEFEDGWSRHFRAYAYESTFRTESELDLIAGRMANAFLRMTTGYYVTDPLDLRSMETDLALGISEGDRERTDWAKGMLSLSHRLEDLVDRGYDRERMEEIRIRLTERIGVELKGMTAAEYQGKRYLTNYNARKLKEVWDRLFPELTEIAGITDADALIGNGTVFTHPYAADLFIGKTALIGGSTAFDIGHVLDDEALTAFLSGLETERGEVSLVSVEAAVFCTAMPYQGAAEIAPVISAGYDGNGRAYLTFFGSRAALTADQLDAFRALCSGPVDTDLTEGGLASTYRAMEQEFFAEFDKAHPAA